MIVGIVQSNYVPWRGYFDFIDDVDLFIFLDDLQYTQRDWRNRNKIKTPEGLRWLTVPVKRGPRNRLINETEIDYSKNWQQRHMNQLRANYTRAPHFASYVDALAAMIGGQYASISELNAALCTWIMEILGITTPTMMSEELEARGRKTERLIDLLTKVGATTYVSGPAAAGYLDVEQFRSHGIRLEYKSYEYAPYPQLWGDFEGGVSVLDLIFNTGPEARKYLKSLVANRKVVE